MDDGCNTGVISCQSFEREGAEKLQMLLKDKFNIKCNIKQSNEIYITMESRELFETIIAPYIHESMTYKLVKVRLKPCDMLETHEGVETTK